MQKIPINCGDKFNRLTVVKLSHVIKYISPKGRKCNLEQYLCKCDCGKETIVSKNNLKSGHAKSCGCLAKEIWHKVITKDNLRNTRLYTTLDNIKARCCNKNNKGYKWYGGRGITICDEWKNDFMAFYNWAMKNGYNDDLTIERINNDGNYEPNNCKWISKSEQNLNKRTTRLLTYNNKTMSMLDWSKELNIDYHTLSSRINGYGWTTEKALSTAIKE